MKLRRGEALTPNTKPGLIGFNDARTGMPFGMPKGAMCVQRFDDSLNSAIHITYRISLRSSSMPEPRDPLLKVFIYLIKDSDVQRQGSVGPPGAAEAALPPRQKWFKVNKGLGTGTRGSTISFNDPSAGSPTETLLRLLLPLNDRV